MPRKPKQEAATRTVYEGGVLRENVLKTLAGRAALRVAPYTRPWLLGAAMFPVAAGSHAMWGDPAVLPWATAGLTLGGAALTGVTWLVSRYRRLIGRLHSTGTTAAASGWLVTATITGPTARPTLDLWLMGTFFLSAAWNIRSAIRENDPDDANLVGDVAGPGALFRKLITGTAEKTDLEITGVRNVKVEPHKVSGMVELGEGHTVDDLQRAVPAMEAAGRLPHGALTAVPNPNDAGAPTVVLSNPLLLDDPILWPGPSRPGRSVAEPLRIGLFQDGTPAEFTLVGSHLQIMGMTGSAKTTGGAWTIWAELVSRKDVALFVIDITKGEQSVGPARPALHTVATTVADAKRLISRIQAKLAERTSYLAERKLIKWREDCGLKYLVLWIEEAADLFDHIDKTEFINLCRAIRSAGGSVVWSLQRADSTQLPTIVKGQGGAYLCFGVANSHDAGWGISDEQEAAGAKPERWRNTKPGMAYIDALGVAPERIAMPLRVYDWGEDDEARVLNFAAFCERFPAAARPLDPITADIIADGAAAAAEPAAGPDHQDDEMGGLPVAGVTREYLSADAELDAADAANPVDLDAELPDVPDIPLGAPRQGGDRAAAARVALERELSRFRNGEPFQTHHLRPVMEETGISRSWIRKQLGRLVADGVLTVDEETHTYRFRVLERVG